MQKHTQHEKDTWQDMKTILDRHSFHPNVAQQQMISTDVKVYWITVGTFNLKLLFTLTIIQSIKICIFNRSINKHKLLVLAFKKHFFSLLSAAKHQSYPCSLCITLTTAPQASHFFQYLQGYFILFLLDSWIHVLRSFFFLSELLS